MAKNVFYDLGIYRKLFCLGTGGQVSRLLKMTIVYCSTYYPVRVALLSTAFDLIADILMSSTLRYFDSLFPCLVRSLSKDSECAAPGEKPQFLGIR
jgi:hypothetical protein